MSRTLVFCDSETGGLDPAIHGLTELAAAAFTLVNNGQAVEIDTFHALVRPNDDMAYCPAALIVQGRTLEQLYAEGTPEPVVYAGFEAFVNKHVGTPDARHGLIWAHNAPFDHGFVYALESRVRGGEAGFTDKTRHFPRRCDWSCTKAKFYDMRAMGVHDGQWSNLKEVARLFGVKPEGKAHTALADVRTGYRCLAAMQEAQDRHCVEQVRASGAARAQPVLGDIERFTTGIRFNSETLAIEEYGDGVGRN